MRSMPSTASRDSTTSKNSSALDTGRVSVSVPSVQAVRATSARTVAGARASRREERCGEAGRRVMPPASADRPAHSCRTCSGIEGRVPDRLQTTDRRSRRVRTAAGAPSAGGGGDLGVGVAHGTVDGGKRQGDQPLDLRIAGVEAQKAEAEAGVLLLQLVDRESAVLGEPQRDRVDDREDRARGDVRVVDVEDAGVAALLDDAHEDVAGLALQAADRREALLAEALRVAEDHAADLAVGRAVADREAHERGD